MSRNQILIFLRYGSYQFMDEFLICNIKNTKEHFSFTKQYAVQLFENISDKQSYATLGQCGGLW